MNRICNIMFIRTNVSRVTEDTNKINITKERNSNLISTVIFEILIGRRGRTRENCTLLCTPGFRVCILHIFLSFVFSCLFKICWGQAISHLYADYSITYWYLSSRRFC